MKRYVLDCETNALIKPSKIWVIVTRNVDDASEVHTFIRPDQDVTEFSNFLKREEKSLFIGHNIIQYDYLQVLEKFGFGRFIESSRLIDTLVCSRLFSFEQKDGLGHGLDAYGRRLGVEKLKVEDWDQGVTDEMINRCLIDTEINLRLFKKMEKHIYSPKWKEALRTEHDMAFICGDMTHNGFGFDKDKAEKMLEEIRAKLAILDKEILKSFPPTIREEVFIPKVNSSKFGYKKDVPFVKRYEEIFNPASPPQIVEKLNEAGWNPVNKTKGHIEAERQLKQCRFKKGSEQRNFLEERLEKFKISGWSVDEENLATLPLSAPPGSKFLAERITLASRERTLVEWLGHYNPETKSIHGSFLPIGSWTGRMAHQNPNQANIPSHPEVKDPDAPTPVEQIKLTYNMPMRALWGPHERRRLIGVDADGIQLRIFAHYTKDLDFIEALVSGNKEQGTDAHTLNAIKLGLGPKGRSLAKIFIYAFLLGAGRDKVAEILKCSVSEATIKQNMFFEAYPGLRRLKEEEIPAIASKGYFEGIDGRYVLVPNEHKVLAGLLQNGESVVMKKANILWRKELKAKGIPFWQLDFVHDEWQTETLDDDEIAMEVENTMVDSIRKVGELYNLNCPLLGTGGSQGYNWAQTH